MNHQDQLKYDYIFEAALHMCRAGVVAESEWSRTLGMFFLTVLNEWERSVVHSENPVITGAIEVARQYRVLAKLPTDLE